VSIEVDGNEAWMFDERSCGELPDAPLHVVLRWALEQLHFGCWRLEPDDKGESVTLVLGRDAAIVLPEPVIESAIEHRRRRDLALNFAGLFAQYREQGIEPTFEEMAETARITASENAYMNTDFYYAFELAGILGRIRENTFLLRNVPLRGRLPERVSRLMGEATRAYMFRLNRSCVSLCRALLEAALSEQVDTSELLQERFRTKKGELECLVNLGVKALGGGALEKAHAIRKTGNEAMHGTEPSDDAAWAVLLDTREILEQLLEGRRAA
jgi:hypothetical protein